MRRPRCTAKLAPTNRRGRRRPTPLKRGVFPRYQENPRINTAPTCSQTGWHRMIPQTAAPIEARIAGQPNTTCAQPPNMAFTPPSSIPCHVFAQPVKAYSAWGRFRATQASHSRTTPSWPSNVKKHRSDNVSDNTRWWATNLIRTGIRVRIPAHGWPTPL